MKEGNGVLKFEETNGNWKVSVVREKEQDLILKDFENPICYVSEFNQASCKWQKLKTHVRVYSLADKVLYDSDSVKEKMIIPKLPKKPILSQLVSKHQTKEIIEEIETKEIKIDHFNFLGENIFGNLKYFPMNNSQLRLPKETRENIVVNDIDNFNLKLNKAVHFFDRKKIENKNEVTKGFPSPELFIGKEQLKNKKYVHFSVDISCSKGFFHEKNLDLISSIQKRQKLIYSSFQNQNHTLSCVIMNPIWRMIVGLGTASVFETGITLHHIYGVPYIPASAIKGVLRNYIINEKYGEDENKAENCPEFKHVFGTTDQKGKVIFFDAFPTKPPRIQQDVMTSHYGDYYTNKDQPPSDNLKTNPIPFLTIAGGDFRFAFVGENVKNFEIDMEVLKDWLKQALENHGIGAKTAVGYGYMKMEKEQ